MTAHPSRSGKSGSALPLDRRSMPIVDACSGTSCKVLASAGTFGRDQPPDGLDQLALFEGSNRGLATTIVCSFGSSYLRPQNRYFTPNCICRGIELPVLEMLPNPVLPKLKSGNPKLRVFVTLYTSARSCNLRVPVPTRNSIRTVWSL